MPLTPPMTLQIPFGQFGGPEHHVGPILARRRLREPLPQTRDVEVAGREPRLQTLRVHTVTRGALATTTARGQFGDRLGHRTVLRGDVLHHRGRERLDGLEMFPHGGLGNRSLAAVAPNISTGLRADVGGGQSFDRDPRGGCGDPREHHLLGRGDDHQPRPLLERPPCSRLITGGTGMY
ncbi:hypothetical protein [Nocardia macrotermitis]|nr:hypothetical protein [Nocardia macrotermitis]